MFSIFWLLIVIAIPLLVVIGVIILFIRVNKLRSDVGVLKQIIYKQSVTSQPQSIPTPVAQASTPVAQQVSMSPAKSGFTEEASGRWLGKLGVLAIILGASFFLKDVFENNWIGPGGRVLIGVIGGVILLVVGQVIRTKYKNYSDLLVGGSYGIFYLTTFGAFYFYELISAPIAYGLFVGITALSVVMSVIDRSSLLASIGVTGGFLAPLLLAGLSPKDAGALAQILSYVLIIDIGVAAVAYVYKWKALSFIAFVGTIFTYLVTLDYYFKPEMRMTVLLFVTMYFIIFLFVSIAHHLVRGERSTTADIFLISLNALMYGVLGASLIEKIVPDDFLGFFCLAVALIYLVTAMLARKTSKDDMLLNFYLPGIATVFLTVAIPAQFDGNSVLVAWLVEALVIVWIAHRTAIKSLMYGGFVVFLVAMIKFIVQADELYGILRKIAEYGSELKKINDHVFLLNERFLYVVFISITGLFIIRALYKAWERWGNKVFGFLAASLFVILNIFLLLNIFSEVQIAYRVAAHNRAVEVTENKLATQRYQDLEFYNEGGDIGFNQKDPQKARIHRYYSEAHYLEYQTKENQREMVNSIIMAFYAAILLVAGFAKNSKFVRICGLVLIFVTAFYIFMSIWDLGSAYRIITALIFGIIALLGSFGYARFSRMSSIQNN